MATFPTVSWYLIDELNTLLFFILLLFNYQKLRTIPNILIILLISSISNFFDYYISSTSIILTFLLNLYLFRRSTLKTISKIFIFVLYLFIISFTQSIASDIVFNFFKFGLNPNTEKSILPTFLVILINYLLSILFAYFIQRLSNKIKESILIDVKIKNIVYFSTFLISLSYVLLSLTSQYLGIQIFYLNIIIAISTSIIILISSITYFFISNRLHEITIENEKQRLQERDIYISELERKNNELHKFKHDYKNFLLSLSASLKSNNIDNDTIQQLLNYSNINVNTNTSISDNNLYHIKNDLIRGIIIAKLVMARNQKIRINSEIDSNISLPKKYSVELTRILGILMDNAIESSLENSNPQIDFAMISFNGYSEIIIRNKLKENFSIEINNIYKSGYSTKKSHSGLGLATVKEIVDGNENFLLQTKIKNGFYTTILTILNDR